MVVLRLGALSKENQLFQADGAQCILEPRRNPHELAADQQQAEDAQGGAGEDGCLVEVTPEPAEHGLKPCVRQSRCQERNPQTSRIRGQQYRSFAG